MNGYIYIINNLVNGKGYIGQTVKSLQYRLNQHRYSANREQILGYSASSLHKAIIKYGIKSFSISLLEMCDTSLLDEREEFYIQKYGTYAPNGKGYNMTKGGEGGSEGRLIPEEIRAKMSAIHKRNSYAKGHHVSEEAKEKMRAPHIGRKPKPLTKESRERISQLLKGARGFFINQTKNFPS